MDEDPKESGGLFIWVQLQLGVDLDDECRGHGREQTSLSFMSVCVRCISLQTHEYQSRVQILIVSLHEFLVVFFGLPAVVSVEFSPKILLARPRVLPQTMRDLSIDQERREAGCYPSTGRPSTTGSPSLPRSPTGPGLGSDVRDKGYR